MSAWTGPGQGRRELRRREPICLVDAAWLILHSTQTSPHRKRASGAFVKYDNHLYRAIERQVNTLARRSAKA